MKNKKKNPVVEVNWFKLAIYIAGFAIGVILALKIALYIR